MPQFVKKSQWFGIIIEHDQKKSGCSEPKSKFEYADGRLQLTTNWDVETTKRSFVDGKLGFDEKKWEIFQLSQISYEIEEGGDGVEEKVNFGSPRQPWVQLLHPMIVNTWYLSYSNQKHNDDDITWYWWYNNHEPAGASLFFNNN